MTFNIYYEQAYLGFCLIVPCPNYVSEEKKPTWTEDEEEELRKLYEEHHHSEGSLSFCLLFAHLF